MLCGLRADRFSVAFAGFYRDLASGSPRLGDRYRHLEYAVIELGFGLVAAGFDLAAGRTIAWAAGLLLIAALAGLAGSLLDSLLGATVQAIYYCDACGQETERHPLHSCGAPTRQVRGWRWMNNDGVNFLSALFGAVLAASLWLLVQ